MSELPLLIIVFQMFVLRSDEKPQKLSHQLIRKPYSFCTQKIFFEVGPEKRVQMQLISNFRAAVISLF